jgi:hypothetical protein
MSWFFVLSPLIICILLAATIGLPPVTGVNADLPHAFEEREMVDAEKRRAWRPSMPGLIVGFGAGISLVLALARLAGAA